MSETPHKIFKGDDYKALEGWNFAYGDTIKKLAKASRGAIRTKYETLPGMTPELRFLEAVFGEKLIPMNGSKPYMEICPDQLLATITLLRDTADMLEDLAKRTGVAHKEWTPTQEKS